MARYDIDTGDYQGIGTGGLLRYAMMQKMAREKAANDMAVAQYQGGIDLVKQGIASGNDYIKSGGAAGLDSLLGTLGIQPGFAKSVAPANAAGLEAILAEAVKNRGQGVKDMANAGFVQKTPDGTVDDMNIFPLEPHVNPGDQAAMVSAQRPNPMMLPLYTSTMQQGSSVLQGQQRGAPPAMPNAQVSSFDMNTPASGANPAAAPIGKKLIGEYIMNATRSGVTVTPRHGQNGTTILDYSMPNGQTGSATFDASGNLVK